MVSFATGSFRQRRQSLTKYLFQRRVREPASQSITESRDDGITLDFSYPREAEQFRKELRSWLSAHLTDDVIAAGATSRGPIRRPSTTLRQWNATMADAGWAAVSWPTEYGGRGATALDQLVYAEETTRARVPLPLNSSASTTSLRPSWRTEPTPQKRDLLPRMLRADDIWCQGMSEPESGSDLASLRTRAVRDGDDFVVTGQKIWTSLGHRADWCQLYVRTDPEAPKHKGISCLIMEHDAHLHLKRLLSFSRLLGQPGQRTNSAVGREMAGTAS